MADRKVVVSVTTRLIIRADEGIPIKNVILDMDYNFTSQTKGAKIEDSEITDYEIKDPK